MCPRLTTKTRGLEGKNLDLYQQLPLLIRSPNKTFLGGAKGCRVALEWSKLMRFNINDKEFLSAVDTLLVTYHFQMNLPYFEIVFIRTAKVKL